MFWKIAPNFCGIASGFWVFGVEILCVWHRKLSPILCQDKMGGSLSHSMLRIMTRCPNPIVELGGGMTPGLGGKIDIQTRVLHDRTKMQKSSFGGHPSSVLMI